MTRRDRCYLVGRRGLKLSWHEAARAWRTLSAELQKFGDRDMPKFDDVMKAIRSATIQSKSHSTESDKLVYNKAHADKT